jgi:hypothetical protein
MKMLRALLALALLASPAAAQNVFFPANQGDMIVKGATTWGPVPGGTAGCVLMSQGPTAAPTWSCALPLNFSLPPMATNRFLGNASGVQAIPTALTINQVLDTVGYDTLRTPTNGSMLVKEPATGTWQALVPSSNVGWVLASAGSLQVPVWAFPGNTATPGAAGTCLVSNGPSPAAPTYQSCLTGLGLTMTNGQLLVGQTGAVPLAKTMSGDGTLDLSGAFTLATVNANVGSFGSATAVPVFTVDGKGRITAVTTAAPTVTSVNGVAYPAAGTTGDLLQATAASTMGRLAAVATGNALISGGVGTVSSWGKIGLTTHVSGVLPVANGGTNASSASGTAVDNISGFASTGIMSRTGAGTYSFSTISALVDAIGSTRGSVLYRGASGWAALTPGASGTVLSSNGAGADPSYIAAGGTGTVTSAVIAAGSGISVSGTCTITTTGTCTITNSGLIVLNKQIFTSSGTYTPSSGMKYAIIECVGGGGGGGGAVAAAATTNNANGGAGGTYSRKYTTAAAVGASQVVTIGAAGTAGTGLANPNSTFGGSGGATSVGALCTAPGGGGGGPGQSASAPAPGVPGAAGTGDWSVPGAPGGPGTYNGTNLAASGNGGSSGNGGGGGVGVLANAVAVAGTSAAANSGGGGAGAGAFNTGAAANGGAGGSGVVIITEFQ